MNKKVLSGLENLIQDKTLQSKIKGKIAILCHNASCTSDFKFIYPELYNIFGKRIIALWGPQHGLFTDVQDNMIETDHIIHPFFKIPVYSLYSETRSPMSKMLDEVDTVLVDLQDVGCRVYTYISTIALVMEEIVRLKKDIEVVILDRPNPCGGEIIEGALLQSAYKSFVGHYEIPMRHGLTIGEFARYTKEIKKIDCSVNIISMNGWRRSQFFTETLRPWILPSPNLPSPSSAINFCGTVLFEGTNVSEGRGTTTSLEVIGHPELSPFPFVEEMNKLLKDYHIEGVILRPLYFMPAFQKHAQKTCGGVQLHITDPKIYRPWRLGQLLLLQLKKTLEENFKWNEKMYEYETQHLAIDYINGRPELRKWVESSGSFEELCSLEQEDLNSYLNDREKILLYP